MAVKLQIRRGLKADLNNLAIGELGYCTDTNELFIGDTDGNTILSGSEVDFLVVSASDSPVQVPSGFVCTGTDDNEVVQAAIDAAVLVKKDILLLPGTYNFSDTVNLYSDIHIYGNKMVTIVGPSSASSTPRMFYALGSSEARLNNIILDGIKFTTCGRCLQAMYVDNLVVTNCETDDVYQFLLVLNTPGAVIRDNKLNEAYIGMSIVSSDNVIIENNIGNNGGGWGLIASNGCLVKGNKLFYDDGEVLGIQLYGASRCNVMDNQVHNATSCGIYLYSGDTLFGVLAENTDHNIISNNIVVVPDDPSGTDLMGIIVGGKNDYYADYNMILSNIIIKSDGVYSANEYPLYLNAFSRYTKAFLNSYSGDAHNTGTDNIIATLSA
jgi:parallel beta-helix repeat protein